MTPTSPAISPPPVTTSVRVPRNTFSEPAVMSSTMASASDTEAARPFPVPRLRLMRASMPPTPSTRPAAPRAFHSDEAPVHFAARAAPRLETRLPLAARSESMMFVRLARFAGIHTDTSTVTNVSTEAAASTQPFTATRKATSPEPASWEMAGPSAAKVAAHPARPMRSPQGMPMTATMAPSSTTARRSCRRDAPTEDRSPNCLMRSATEMLKALKISDTHATTMTAASTTTRP